MVSVVLFWRHGFGVLLVICFALVVASFGEEDPAQAARSVGSATDRERKIVFSIPKGDARKTLVKAARQANIEFICAPEILRGVKTPAIQGPMSVREMFALMLSDSALMAKRHGEQGIYIIKLRAKTN